MDPDRANRYVNQVQGQIVNRELGERLLLELLPEKVERVLDLGTGDGRILSFVLEARPAATGVGLDISPTMIDHAKARFGDDSRVQLELHDLNDSVLRFGEFDAVVSCFGIHHVEDPRKRSLYEEIFRVLKPGGLFANLEHVSSPTERLHRAFFDAIGIPVEREDASNRCSPADVQVGWLREIGFDDADCYWKWRELALLAGYRR